MCNDYGYVELPFALARKYPNADRELIWQYAFPSVGHKDVKTTMIYTHVLQRGPLAVRSPLD